MKILIREILALLPAADGFRTERTNVAISGDEILAVGDIPEGFRPERVLDGRDRMVIPGLINAHTHAYMSILRSVADDVPFEDWLFRGVQPKEDRLTPEDAYWSALLGMMEMIRRGTTCFNDQQMHIHQTTKAAVDIGMRGVIGRGLSGDAREEGGERRLREAREEYDRWKDEPLLSFMISPHAPYSCTGALIQKAANLSEELGIGIHIHLSESANEVENVRKEHGGMTPIEYMDSLGLFRRPTLAAHCVHVTDNDIRILADRGVSVVTNPASNMKLGNGFAPVPDMLDAGVNVCLGTDGAASNNAQNMFREMGLLTLIHKGVRQNAVSVSATDALKMSTVRGARALGFGDSLGEIAPGKKADLAILNLDCPEFTPLNNPVSQLTYAADGSEVETVIIGGEIVMENRHFRKIDEERVMYEVRRRAGAWNQ